MPRLTDDTRDAILQRWRAGESQNSLAKHYKCAPATVNAICKGVAQDNASIVKAQVQINQILNAKPNNEANAIREVIDEKTRYLKFFNDSALKNQQLANERLKSLDLTMQELNAHSSITQRNKETVLGKDITTAIQVNNHAGNPETAKSIIEQLKGEI